MEVAIRGYGCESMLKRLRPLPWYGGKQAQGKAKWIASILPWSKKSTYCEPFGGMASVLLNREPVKREIYNDLDERVVNWWRILSNHPKEFGHAVECLPHSEIEFKRSKKIIDDLTQSPLDRAVAFHCLALQSVRQDLNSPNWQLRFNYTTGSNGRWRSERISVLAERMWDVQLSCRPATHLLEKLVDREYTTIYCDPPYITRNTNAYKIVDVDQKELSDLFRAQRGDVAISGTDNEWDHLGWSRHEKSGIRDVVPGEKARTAKPFTEVLWTNF